VGPSGPFFLPEIQLNYGSQPLAQNSTTNSNLKSNRFKKAE